jgi:hypothetical protein
MVTPGRYLMYVRYALAVLAGAGALVVGTVLAAAGPAQATGGCSVHSPATDAPQTCFDLTDAKAADVALRGTQGSSTPLIEAYDYANNPIATLGQTGGFSVFGDSISVYPQGNVFTPAIQLNGFTSSASKAYVLLNGVKVFAGSAAPSGSCTAPSWYLASSAMYHCVSGAWAQYG